MHFDLKHGGRHAIGQKYWPVAAPLVVLFAGVGEGQPLPKG